MRQLVSIGNGKRFVVRSDEKLTAFLKLEAAIAATANAEETTWQTPEPWASEVLAKAISSTTYFVLSAQIERVHKANESGARSSQVRTLDAAVVIPA